jgi:hypothetical protein
MSFLSAGKDDIGTKYGTGRNTAPFIGLEVLRIHTYDAILAVRDVLNNINVIFVEFCDIIVCICEHRHGEFAELSHLD